MRPLPLVIAVLLALGCRPSSAQSRAGADATARPGPAPAPVASVYAGGYRQGWEDYGWAPRLPKKSTAEHLELSGYGGWILNNRAFTEVAGGLRLRVRAPAALGDFLEVRYGAEDADDFPRVRVGPTHRRELPDGWTELFIPMSELNPSGRSIKQIVLRAHRPLPKGTGVEIDDIALTAVEGAVTRRLAEAAAAPGRPVAFTVACAAPAREISPLVYGIAYSPLRERQTSHQWKLGAAARRWGGNPTSRYNWQLGDAWNTAADYYFRNVDYEGIGGAAYERFLAANAQREVASALTVPILGWVAKDASSYSFPVSELGAQQSSDPSRPNAGNGVDPKGTPLPSPAPTRTSVPAPPEFVERWVRTIRAKDEGRRSVALYILDNEPMLWHDTHRDVHPEPTSYDELLRRTIEYGAAVRRADPGARIAGPALWGWPAYFFSAVDAKAGFSKKPDRRAHGDVPFLPWYLRQLAEHERRTGVRLLDVLDVHFYPQGKGIGIDTNGDTDPATAARRIRATRALWDPTYRDESWIDEPVELIPRLRRWVDENYPGLELSIGEYNFGAERHGSGGVALAEALGRFGQHGLFSAFYWTYPPEGSAAFWAFRAFRDYDGAGARFQDWSIPTKGPEGASLFAARNADGTRLTLVALNHSGSETLEGSVALEGCAPPRAERVFTYAGAPQGLAAVSGAKSSAFRMPPYSITVVEAILPAKARGGGAAP